MKSHPSHDNDHPVPAIASQIAGFRRNITHPSTKTPIRALVTRVNTTELLAVNLSCINSRSSINSPTCAKIQNHVHPHSRPNPLLQPPPRDVPHLLQQRIY